MLCYRSNKKLLEVDITQKRIWYFCVPTHSNLGDQAQACCIEKYFRKFFSDHIVFKLSNNAFDFYEEKILMILKEKIKETDLIFSKADILLQEYILMKICIEKS